MRKRNVSAVNEIDNDSYPYEYGYEEYTEYGGSGNVPNLGIAGSSGGVIGGFPQLPKLPTGTQQPKPNLELYNLRCPDGFKIVRGQCKSVASSGSANGTGGANGATNDEGSGANGANGSGANGANDVANDEASGSGTGRIRTNRSKKYWLPIVIIGALAIGYFSIKKVLNNG